MEKRPVLRVLRRVRSSAERVFERKFRKKNSGKKFRKEVKYR
jgi:hypothetical protein